MGLWGALKKVVNSNFSKPLDTLITEKTTHIEGGNVPIVRHIQRGVTSYSSYPAGYQEITLSGFTNVDKMSVRLNNGYRASYVSTSDTSYAVIAAVYPSALTTDALTLQFAACGTRARTDASYSISYEVIEYY